MESFFLFKFVFIFGCTGFLLLWAGFLLLQQVELLFIVEQFSSVAHLCLTLRLPGIQHARLPCHHQLPELTQTLVHRIGDAIQPSHSLLSPSPPAFNLSQEQGLFQ